MKSYFAKPFIFKTLLALIVSLSFFCSFTHAQEFREVKKGVEYLQIVRKGDGADVWSINLLRIDLIKADIQLKRAMDEAIGLETTSSLAQRYGAVAAINSGFFRTTGTYRGESAGVLQIDGKLLSDTYNNRAAVGFIHKGNQTEIIFGHLKFEGFVEANKKQKLNINGINTVRGENQLILYTPEFHRTTLTDANGVEVVVKNNRVISIKDKAGSARIAENSFVLSAIGTARDWILKNLKAGISIKIQTTLTAIEDNNESASIQNPKSKIKNQKTQWQMTNGKWQMTNNKWQMADDIVGGRPQLIRNGKIEITLEQENIGKDFSTTRHPRTAIAKLKDGKVLLVTVDGRQPNHSVGMSLDELANLLLEFGATDAVNLDGGGSTTMVVENKVVNKPSDQTGERAVSDALLVFERKWQQ